VTSADETFDGPQRWVAPTVGAVVAAAAAVSLASWIGAPLWLTAASTAACWATWWGRRLLIPLLGAATAGAAVMVTWALVSATAIAVPASCAIADQPDSRCDTETILRAAFLGAMVAAMLLAAAAGFAATWRVAHRSSGAARDAGSALAGLRLPRPRIPSCYRRPLHRDPYVALTVGAAAVAGVGAAAAGQGPALCASWAVVGGIVAGYLPARWFRPSSDTPDDRGGRR
jgi:hypothetical protein